eukprot:SAG11_NODE_105_length_16528_cov_4.337635_5_plen_1992_part_00
MGSLTAVDLFILQLCALLAGALCDTELQCRDGYVYQGFDAHRTYSEASSACVDWGGNLVSIGSSDENEFVSTLMNSMDNTCSSFGQALFGQAVQQAAGSSSELSCGWIGARWSCGENSPCPQAVPELSPASFLWDDGTHSLFSAWAPGEPGAISSGGPIIEAERCAWMSWQAAGGWDDIDCGSRIASVCKRPMSAHGSECGHATSLPPPPPYSAECSVGNFADILADVSATCCPNEDNGCSAGPPPVCTPACATKWIPFMEECGDFLSQTAMSNTFNAFSHLCNTAEVAAQNAGCTIRDALPMVMTCLADTMDAESFCGGTCFATADSFLSQCESAGGILSTFVPELRTAVDACRDSPPPPAASAGGEPSCDVSTMNALCDGFTIAEPADLCSAPCIAFMVNSYDACARTPGMEDVVAQMQPYVQQCHGISLGCDVHALNQNCVNFQPPTDGNIDVLCADPCISHIVDHFDACRADPQLAGLVEQMHAVVEPCQSHGEERNCWSLMDQFHHNAEAECCPDGGCGNLLPGVCSDDCAEFYVPFFSRCAKYFYEPGDHSLLAMEEFNEICAQSMGRADVFNSEPVDACASRSCHDCNGECGWCSVRGGICSSECQTSPGECNAYGASNSTVDRCGAFTNCATCTSGMSALSSDGASGCSWCSAGGKNVCSAHCANENVLVGVVVANTCPDVVEPVGQRVYHSLQAGGDSGLFTIQPGETVYAEFDATAGTTYRVVVHKIDLPTTNVRILSLNATAPPLVQSRSRPGGDSMQQISWSCHQDGPYTISVGGMGSVSHPDAGSFSLGIVEMAPEDGPCRPASNLQDTDWTGLQLTDTQGVIHFTNVATVGQMCKWDIKCPIDANSPDGSRVSLQLTNWNLMGEDNVMLFEDHGTESVENQGDPTTLTRITVLHPDSQVNRPYQSSTSEMVIQFDSLAPGLMDNIDHQSSFAAQYVCLGRGNKQAGRDVRNLHPNLGITASALTDSNHQAWFAFPSIVGKSYYVEIRLVSLLTSKLFVYDSTDSDAGDQQIATGTSSVEFTATSSRTTIMVVGGDPSQTGTFGITIVTVLDACDPTSPGRSIDARGKPGTVYFQRSAYLNNEHCSWTVDCAHDEVVHFSVLSLATEADKDFVRLYSRNAHGDELAALSGSIPALQVHTTNNEIPIFIQNGHRIPREYNTADPQGAVTFSSNAQMTGGGFSIAYSCMDNPATHPEHHTDGPTTTAHDHQWQLVRSQSGESVNVPVTPQSLRQFFSFDATAQSTYTISVSLHQLLGADVVFYDRDATMQLDSVFVNAGGSENTITWTCVSPGNYKIMVTALLAADTASGSFTLTVQEHEVSVGGSPSQGYCLSPGDTVNQDPSEPIVIAPDAQQHALDFGATSENAHICLWVLQCEDETEYVSLDITRFAIGEYAHVRIFGGVLDTTDAHAIASEVHPRPNELGDVSRTVTSASTSTYDTFMSPQSSMSVIFVDAPGPDYAGFTGMYQCTDGDTSAPSVPSSGDSDALITTLCLQGNLDIQSSCCEPDENFSRCFNGPVRCSQACAQNFVPVLAQCGTFAHHLHIDALPWWNQLSELCPAALGHAGGDTLPPPPPAVPVAPDGLTQVVFRLDMRGERPDGMFFGEDGMFFGEDGMDHVYVNGDFNSWCGVCDNEMSPGDTAGVFELTLPMPPGDYQYEYSINGFDRVEVLPDNGCGSSAAGTHRSLTVAAETVINSDIWGSCRHPVTPSPTPPPPPTPPTPPATHCLCKRTWSFRGSTYHDCANAPYLHHVCYVDGPCNGAHGAMDGDATDLWIACTDANVQAPIDNTTDPSSASHLPPDIVARRLAHSQVTQLEVDGVSGYTTYRLSLRLDSKAQNVYTIFGDESHPMRIPAAYQVAAPFGADIAGTQNALWSMMPTAQYDSWLTVGMVEGNDGNALASVGIVFSSWDEQHALFLDDGAVFWMDPDNGPRDTAVVGQLTIPTGTPLHATMSAQGRSTSGPDWQEDGLVFQTGTANEHH